jgi:UDP-N-acetylmuramoyl-tripeptide--D-alanyl-D-alanine ligase
LNRLGAVIVRGTGGDEVMRYLHRHPHPPPGRLLRRPPTARTTRARDYVAEALKRGAIGIIAGMHARLHRHPRRHLLPSRFPTPLAALGDIAREWRIALSIPPRCAVTGSSGKTTTKEMLAHILSRDFDILATEGNFNNQIGLPLTLLRLRAQHKLAVLEVGMNHAGELTELARLAIPDISVITNVGNAHIGNFGSIEKLAAAKAELLVAMPKEGTAILNLDCPNTAYIRANFEIPTAQVTFGTNARAHVRAENIENISPFGYSFDLLIGGCRQRVELGVFGRYQVSNALAAAAVSLVAGIDPERIAERLSMFQSPSMRASVEWIDGTLVITDCYNASPDAMLGSVNSMFDVNVSGRRVAMLGDMFELGESAVEFHRDVGMAVAEAGFDMLCTLGENSRHASDCARAGGVESIHFTSPDDAAEFLGRQPLAERRPPREGEPRHEDGERPDALPRDPRRHPQRRIRSRPLPPGRAAHMIEYAANHLFSGGDTLSLLRVRITSPSARGLALLFAFGFCVIFGRPHHRPPARPPGRATHPPVRPAKMSISLNDSHFQKAGTPSMGGLLMLGALVGSVVMFTDFTKSVVILSTFAMLGFCMVGFRDDYLKITGKNNKGMSARAKLVGQFVVALIFAAAYTWQFCPASSAIRRRERWPSPARISSCSPSSSISSST